MAHHRIHAPELAPLAVGPVVIGGEEAKHAARVKRLGPGDAVDLLDGRGNQARATVLAIEKAGRDGWALRLTVRAVDRVDPVSPRIEVFAPAPKASHLHELVDGLSQVGAAVWHPLRTRRSIAEKGALRAERLERITGESAKQCGRAWVMEIGEAVDLDAALARPGPLILADERGAPYEPTRGAVIGLIVGPEGGLDEGERAAAIAAGARPTCFGPHTMRIETAAPIGAAIILDAERRAAAP